MEHCNICLTTSLTRAFSTSCIEKLKQTRFYDFLVGRMYHNDMKPGVKRQKAEKV